MARIGFGRRLQEVSGGCTLSALTQFRPEASLVPGAAHPQCRAIVVLPARNEEESLPAALDALAAQMDEAGVPLPTVCFEILLLLNNCTDGSASISRRWKAAHPHIHLHTIEIELPSACAHVGKARRLLMDTAWQRLAPLSGRCAILSTDSDTVVASDWISRNLRALELGADAVGGAIWLKRGELEALSPGTRHAYLQDRRYQQLVAELEDLIDPQAGDAWPRHLDHFGASLACTAQAYAQAGGMPRLRALEDVAFVDALRRANACLRHEPAVVVYTSLRLDGRTEIGFSGQLRLWQQMSEEGEEQGVLSAAWLVHRFETLQRLRALFAQHHLPQLGTYPRAWRGRITREHSRRVSVAQFLGDLDCDSLIDETFLGVREEPIARVTNSLMKKIALKRAEKVLDFVPVPNISRDIQGPAPTLGWPALLDFPY